MKNILIVDTETTGIDVDSWAKIIEIGAVYYSIEHKTIIHHLSTLLPCESNEAYKINKITPESTLEAHLHDKFNSLLSELYSSCDAVVAHNAEFDRKMLKQHVNEWSIKTSSGIKPWICSCDDFRWPDMTGRKKLTDIALSLGLPVFAAHRALTDCILLADCFSRLDDLKERFLEAAKPRAIYIAKVTYEARNLAKDKGFIWNTVSRQWESRLSEDEAKQITEFNVVKAQIAQDISVKKLN